MLRRLVFVLTLGAVVSLVSALEAQQEVVITDQGTATAAQPPAPKKENWWQRWKRDYHRNQCWPEPFIAGDRQAVIVPFQIMADNAWQRQNLLNDYHFVEGTTELNNAGQYRLRWIITKAAPQRRAIYVERSLSDEATAERIRAVQNAVARLAPNRPPLPVYESNLGAGDWLGEDADATLRDAAKSRPEPRLPTAARPAISQ